MKQKILFVLTALTFLIINSCKDDITGPEPSPGRRDYVWTLDTIYSSFNFFQRLWGSSPSDLWVVGPGGRPFDRVQHFDGTKWTPFENFNFYGVETVFGFSKNNVWAGGGDGRIYHFNGVRWIENFVYTYNGTSSYVYIDDIWGDSPSNIYALGLIMYKENGLEQQKGTILKYNGQSWNEVYVSNKRSQFGIIRQQDNKQIIMGIVLYQEGVNEDTLFFSEYDGNKLTRVYSGPSRDWCGLSTVGNELYFTIGKDTYTYKNGGFKKEFTIDDKNFGWSMWGRNKNDIFIGMYDGIGHYNGTDFQYLFRFDYKNVFPVSAVLFDDEVFFLINDFVNDRNYVLRGKLK